MPLVNMSVYDASCSRLLVSWTVFCIEGMTWKADGNGLKCRVKNAIIFGFNWMYFLFVACGHDIISLPPAHMPLWTVNKYAILCALASL